MKKLITLIAFFIITNSLSANHLSGGEIWHEYVGNSANPNKYRIHLKLYRDLAGDTLGLGPATICITSSCFADTNISMPFKPYFDQIGTLDTLSGSLPGTYIIPLSLICDTTSPSSLLFSEVYNYAADVSLPGNCQDYTFAYSAGLRKPSDNLLDSTNFYIKTTLNNYIGPNHGSKIISPLVFNFCTNKPSPLLFYAFEPDGDSIRYEFTNPLTGNCDSTGINIGYKTGYNANFPLITQDTTAFNPLKVPIWITPSHAQSVTIALTVYEYRYYNGVWHQISTSMLDLHLNFETACMAEDTSWFTTIINGTGQMNHLPCNEDKLTIATGTLLDFKTLATDGSDFKLFNSKDSLLSIIEAGEDLYPFGPSSRFWIKLNHKLWYNDTLTLVSKIGSDQNTLHTLCGDHLAEGDSIKMVVNVCSTGIGLNQNHLPSNITIYPNPATNQLYLAAPYNTRKVEATIYTASGQPIKTTWLGKTDNRIDIKDLPRGLYFISLKGENIQQAQSFQKE